MLLSLFHDFQVKPMYQALIPLQCVTMVQQTGRLLSRLSRLAEVLLELDIIRRDIKK